MRISWWSFCAFTTFTWSFKMIGRNPVTAYTQEKTHVFIRTAKPQMYLSVCILDEGRSRVGSLPGSPPGSLPCGYSVCHKSPRIAGSSLPVDPGLCLLYHSTLLARLGTMRMARPSEIRDAWKHWRGRLWSYSSPVLETAASTFRRHVCPIPRQLSK